MFFAFGFIFKHYKTTIMTSKKNHFVKVQHCFVALFCCPHFNFPLSFSVLHPRTFLSFVHFGHVTCVMSKDEQEICTHLIIKYIFELI